MRRVALVLAFALGLAAVAYACNVPVFRFALERWRPDPYQVVLFHKGPLDAATLELIRPLEEQQDKALANLALRTVDVSEFDKPADDSDEQAALDRALFAAQGEVALPRLVVLYPPHLRILKPAWSGPLSRESVSQLLDSPARRELIKRLAEGQTAVWVLLEPAASDSASVVDSPSSAAVLLEAELKKLAEELKLPELTTAPEDALLAQTPLRVEFSLLRLRRDDPAEQALISLLIGSEPDLAERKNDPLVFPVFGRGRALLPLIGAGITAKNIHDSAAFLVGPCSCEVKELNPGFDLLLSTDWDKELTADGTPLTAATTTQAPSGPPVLVPIPAGASQVTEVYQSPLVSYGFAPRLSFSLIVLGGAVLLGIFVVALIVALSQSRGRSES